MKELTILATLITFGCLLVKLVDHDEIPEVRLPGSVWQNLPSSE